MEMITGTPGSWDVAGKGSAVKGQGDIAGRSTGNCCVVVATTRRQPLSGRVDNWQYWGTEELQTLNTVTEDHPKPVIKMSPDTDAESQFIAGI